MGLSSQQSHIVTILGFSFGVLSLFCSLLTLFLIHYMKNWNGYLLLIVLTTICQIAYDLNYIIGIEKTYDSCVAWHALDVFGGLGVALLTNVVSGIILYVVLYVESLDIFRMFPFIFVGAVLVPLVLGILCWAIPPVLVETDDSLMRCSYNQESKYAIAIEYIYYWGRLLSIIVNFVVFAFITLRLKRMAIIGRVPAANRLTSSTQGGDLMSTGGSGSSALREAINNQKAVGSSSGSSTAQSLAIYTLVSRMKYYPFVQALCRFGAAWNEFDDYKYQTFPSAIVAGICSPSTGFCYFIVFLIMQPQAWVTLKSFFSLEKIGEVGAECPDSFTSAQININSHDLHAMRESIDGMDEATLEWMINNKGATPTRDIAIPVRRNTGGSMISLYDANYNGSFPDRNSVDIQPPLSNSMSYTGRINSRSFTPSIDVEYDI